MQSFKTADQITKHNTGNIPQDEDCQPKDLSFKSIKKMKPIPPPLNLGTANSALKEFAIIATSPKSPLMQKNLPFRKRAYSFSETYDTGVQPTPSGTHLAMEVPEQRSALHSLNEEACQVSSAFVRHSTLVDTRLHYPAGPTCSFLAAGSSSPSHWITSTSVLLSPAPSSLGSSREELNPGDTVRLTMHLYPWPSPVWHCFQPGVLLKLDLPNGGTSGAWKLAEELSKFVPDWLGALQVEQVSEIDGGIMIRFTCQEQCQGEVTAQCNLYHTFYIKDRGWCAVYPEHVFKQYGVSCQRLEQTDICLPSSRVPVVSPDICDKFKRFSFPPEGLGMPSHLPTTSHISPLPPPDSFLSPPTSPTKKVRDTDRPKRPMNAFMLFAKRYRPELIPLHPGKDNRAISVILGEAWRNLPPADKEVYVTEARAMAQERKRLHPDCWKRKRSHSAGFLETSSN
ncbi:HMG box-containing protein 1-like isoform X2 [Zootermopsis nevadensis]|uniref:HMG box-containing protein 1 n=2 Tax=Zootermopsis nevadensis TaxID=136037 RepID=A0A067RAR4_ZOONE|nr:HMG box-containing protein 1-like isoform X2 [Zootermopsis nevadensis]XP_021924834.1 HMG box-containing protein 1-like isoform X2 [Zootermopsis nevadensis]XP_021924835.1 HMG box-containing protein 1-like isoform X2 [Zootermopsis nevadensis]XP_021924836.1 HMG box-containing protein 1-like isoform X2 [Zootermopsis nevadensis]KDR16774.1 HMG box-containing protein 1 [Zootermopsis nevadensis]